MRSSEPLPHPPRVLIVEDESRLRELLLEEIPDMGFAATAARSAEEAGRVMEATPHEIMLLDLRLPVMGGMDFLQRVRASWPKTQVVILTGFGDLDAARRAIRLDVADFLTKPCRLREVEQALDRARRRIGTGEGPADPPSPPAKDSQNDLTLKEIERERILATLARHQGNRTTAARALGISRRTLHYKLSEYQSQGHRLE